MIVPKEFDLKDLDCKRFVVNEDGVKYEFVAGIYEQKEEGSCYSSFGICCHHPSTQNYLNFHNISLNIS